MSKQLISITKSAFPKLLEIQKKFQSPYLTFGIKSGGCSGFQYVLQPCHQVRQDEELFIQEELQIKIDKVDTFLLLGTEIDWENDIMGQRFIFNNPNSNFECGCGKSFS